MVRSKAPVSYFKKATLAFLAGAFGGLLAFGVAHLLGYAENPGRMVSTVIFVSILSVFAVDVAPEGVVNWPLYCGKCALYTFLLVSVQTVTAELI